MQLAEMFPAQPQLLRLLLLPTAEWWAVADRPNGDVFDLDTDFQPPLPSVCQGCGTACGWSLVVGRSETVGPAVKSEQFQDFKLFLFCPVESNSFDILFCYFEELELSMWAKSILRKVDQLRGSKTARIIVGGRWCPSCTYFISQTAEFIKLNQEDHDKQLKPENLHLRLFAQV